MRYSNKAFTLVEILIVVIILGILAAIVVPQFNTASYSARETTAMTDLRDLRSQLQLYFAQHNGTYPTDFSNQMAMCTDVLGNTNVGFTSTYRFGPYMVRVPQNPFTTVSTVTTVTGVATAYSPAADLNQGWWYNSTTAEIRCHVPDSLLAADGRQVNQL
jgi:general secretion pathway protein G